ncbi:MAG: hypothetical protein WC451_02660 [Patescibacteria group bacterium]|jgi:hypothetical protein
MKTMVFASINEDGLNKAEWMASLPKGAKVVTRRKIEHEDLCVCGQTYRQHLDAEKFIPPQTSEEKKYINLVELILGHSFTPAKYAIGKKICIQKKRCGGALCRCGKEYSQHHQIDRYMAVALLAAPPNTVYSDKVKEQIKETKTCISSSELILKGVGASTNTFKPVLYEITSGMWHKDWFNTRRMPYYANMHQTKKMLEQEAKLEGFDTYDELVEAFKLNEKTWGPLKDSWRIRMERIQ